MIHLFPFSLEGNIGAIFGRILDVYWLSKEEHDKIRDPFIQSFESLNSLEICARGLDDFQLAGMAKIVREYARILPDAVYDMMKVSKRVTERPRTARASSCPQSSGPRVRSIIRYISIPTLQPPSLNLAPLAFRLLLNLGQGAYKSRHREH